ncbi:hypothetical protein BOTNAR_0215g00170 [Botryotinia narcissicola]|uniref:Acetyl xylan esterase domain-containing protein n=1 Tax=Botryotinia narcissicola TaxID=278944 RepID=A0A4Z1IBA1_9HELO|nr:hypothetical protein BOTNAR_0215g00170 [Botryotinia narcissicola]
MPSLTGSNHEDVNFKTVDGLTLRGWLYPVAGKSPAVIMSPGFNCTKEMLLPDVASQFQLSGINALIYDPRSIGLSDGTPRNEIDPMKQTEDYSDALTYMSGLSSVDSSKIAFWGMSFGGTVAMCATALDKRAKMCIALRGNPPFSLAPFTANGVNPVGMADGGGLEAYEFMVHVRNKEAASFVNKTTIQSYYKIAMWQPRSIFKLMQTAVMMLVPELDAISSPQDQMAVFDDLTGPKREYMVKGQGHLNVLSGDEFLGLMERQVEFINDVLEGILDD